MKPDAGLIAAPVLESLVTLAVLEPESLVIHAFPAPSMAMPNGLSRPPPVNPEGGLRSVPLLEILVTLLLLILATQALPESSTATDEGLLS